MLSNESMVFWAGFAACWFGQWVVGGALIALALGLAKR